VPFGFYDLLECRQAASPRAAEARAAARRYGS